uniref:Protein kinase domain-containing protein n=1 Tax=Ciona intestinalis TaxID=7719 RepID=H2Y147_CIOIN
MLCKPNLDTTLLKCEVNSSAVLGTGCSGTTYKALHGVYGDVAAKLLKYNNDVNRKAANEIDLLSSINGNKFVVNYFGWNYVKHSGIEYPLIVMEYMECGSLHDVLYKDSSIDFHYSLRKRAMKEFAEGLRFLHFHLYGKHPIVHCDLKVTEVEINSPTRCLMLGAKKVGKHEMENLYKHFMVAKRLKNEPYNEFIIISQKHYEAYSPAIDVVLLCFAC